MKKQILTVLLGVALVSTSAFAYGDRDDERGDFHHGGGRPFPGNNFPHEVPHIGPGVVPVPINPGIRPGPVFGHPVAPGYGPGPGYRPPFNHGNYYLHGGRPGWNHWVGHPAFVWQTYDNWNWQHVRAVTCTAVDQYGYPYSVIEDSSGWDFRGRINDIQGDALDRCYNESPARETCQPQSCEPTYPGY